MCGQLGIVLGRKERSRDELDYLRKVFTYLLMLNEQRGPHATGVVWMKRSGQYCIAKRPEKASDFVRDAKFRDVLASVSPAITWLGGHTRWQTVGDASNNLNNHSIQAGEVVGTHNGTIVNADALFAHFCLPRAAEVDSELIFRLADSTLTDRRIDVNRLKKRLALCRGGISAVMASKLAPEEIVVIKGNRPLEMWYDPGRQIVAYCSEERHLRMALVDLQNWRRVELRPMTIAVFKCDCLETSTCESFNLSYCTEADRTT